MYRLSKEVLEPILCINLLYKFGRDLLDIQYTVLGYYEVRLTLRKKGKNRNIFLVISNFLYKMGQDFLGKQYWSGYKENLLPRYIMQAHC